jgi:hypothetical protein
MSHTPGPWWVEDSDHPMGEGREVYDGFGRTASVYGDSPTAEANARLIAAAPEMLAALIEAYTAITYMMSNDDCGGASSALDQVIAAIAKAEGRE